MVGASQNVIIQNGVMDIVHHEEYVLGYDMASVGKWFVTYQRIIVPPSR
jgi:hypothetical protein